jgi:hypothetical protein
MNNSPTNKALQAADSNTSAKTLCELAKDRNASVRWRVAIHSSTPTRVLAELAKDTSWNVRYMVAKNFKTSAEVLVELANDKDADVRRAVLANPNCHEAVKMWAKNGGFAGLTPMEFIKEICGDNNEE